MCVCVCVCVFVCVCVSGLYEVSQVYRHVYSMYILITHILQAPRVQLVKCASSFDYAVVQHSESVYHHSDNMTSYPISDNLDK